MFERLAANPAGNARHGAKLRLRATLTPRASPYQHGIGGPALLLPTSLNPQTRIANQSRRVQSSRERTVLPIPKLALEEQNLGMRAITPANLSHSVETGY